MRSKIFTAIAIVLVGAVAALAAVDGSLLRLAFQPVGGRYQSSPSTLATGEQDELRLTSAGLLRVSLDANTVGTTTQEVVGDAADGAAVAGNPVLVGGQDGTNAQSLLVDTSGRPNVVGASADGAAKAGNPVLIAGEDGTNAQTLLTDSSGRQVNVGASADGTAVAGNPLLIAGQDGTNAQSIKTDASGELQIDVLTAAISGDVAHDGADAGAPLKLGGKAITGAVATAVSAANDRADAHFDMYGRQVTRKAGSWQVQHTPAANTQATISQAAGAAGVKNVCTSITCTFSGNASSAAAVGTVFNLRDGATGAGTILWSGTIWITATAGSSNNITLDDLWIEGTAATAMTLEAAAAGGANTLQSVAMTGTITQ